MKKAAAHVSYRNIQKLAQAEEDIQTEEFKEHLQRLQSLVERRQALQKKLDQYRHIQQLLQPLQDPQESIQPKLVTRDGPLGEELNKSRTLNIRVAGGVARVKGRTFDDDEDGDEDAIMVDDSQKLAELLRPR